MNDTDKFTTLDTVADGLLRLCIISSWLLLASFFIVSSSTTRARSEELACGGRDLIAGMNPVKLDALRKEAANTVNGKGLLWKIEKPGVEPSFLYGTMHLTDPRVLKLSDAADLAYRNAGTVVIETTEVLDPKASIKVMAETPELMMFMDDTTLDKIIPRDQLETVRTALSERGISLAAVNRMQPWMLTSMLAVPACELARTKEGTAFLDIKLAEDAKAQGKRIAGLETIRDQLGAMASLPAQFHIDGLIETLALGPELPDIFETMTILYTRGDIGMIFPLMHSVSPDSSGGANYAEFEEKMVNARNRTMADRAIPLIDRGNAFIAVGALHLPGDQGLISLLRQRGYSISAGQ
jgi:uncharacterized protein YbaP (TraB family)